MKAITWNCARTQFELSETNIPKPNKDEVLIKIEAASLNHIDLWLLKGAFNGMLQTDFIGGTDGAGRVIEVGENVGSELLGADVLINPAVDWINNDVPGSDFRIHGIGINGTFAEYVCVNKNGICLKPKYLSYSEGAALPMALTTAYRALVKRARLQSSDKLLITGIGGGVAQLALQIAVALGANVYVTSSSQEKIDQAISLGATGGRIYTDESFATATESFGEFDIILDSGGGINFSKLPSLTRHGGKIVSIGGTAGMQTDVNLQEIFSKQLSIIGSLMGSTRDLADAVDFYSNHRLKPALDSEVPIESFHCAIEKFGKAATQGKIIIRH